MWRLNGRSCTRPRSDWRRPATLQIRVISTASSRPSGAGSQRAAAPTWSSLPRRSHHQQMVAPRGHHLEHPLGLALASRYRLGREAAIPQAGLTSPCTDPPASSLHDAIPRRGVAEYGDRFMQRSHAGQRQIGDLRSLDQARGGENQKTHLELSRRFRHRQHASGRLYSPIQRHFADGGNPFRGLGDRKPQAARTASATGRSNPTPPWEHRPG